MSIIRDGFQSADLDVPVVLPTLNLDFANSQELDPRITFSRGSIGTFVNKNGLIETADANIPRFDYDPISGECRGLLIEESRVNYFSYSIPSVSGWFNTNLTNSTVSFTAPDGSNTATLLTATSINNQSRIESGGQRTPTTTYTQSCFCKAGTTNYVTFGLYDTTSGTAINRQAIFYLVGSGSVTSVTDGTASIAPYPNGWYRCTMTTTISAGASYSGSAWKIGICNNPTAYYNTNIGDSVYIWGAQLETGAFPTTYIPTSGSTVTRSVDNANMTGTNFSSWYNQSEGTFFFDGTLPFITTDSVTSGARVPYGVSNGFNFANSMYVSKGNTSLGLSFSVINNNVAQTTGTSLSSMTSSRFKISSAFADKNIYSCGYGGTVNKNSKPSAAIPTVNRLTLGREPWNTSPLNPIIGCIRKFAYYPRALSPAQLQYLTQ